MRGKKVTDVTAKHKYLTANEKQAETSTVLKLLQREMYGEEIRSIKPTGKVSKSSSLIRLNPIIRDGLLRVGG